VPPTRRIRPAQNPRKVASARCGSLLPGGVGASRSPIETLWRGRGCRKAYGSGQARKGSFGWNPGQAGDGRPWKGRIPRELPARRGLILLQRVRDSREGQSPEAGVRHTGPGTSSLGDHGGLTARGFGAAETRRPPLGRTGSEGTNPRGATGMRKARSGSGGSNPPGG
jgi:hypothetical protein